MNNYSNANNRQRPSRPRPPFPQRPPYFQQPPFYQEPSFPGAPPFEPPTDFSPSPDSLNGPPTGAPPSFVPQQSPGLYAVDPGSIRRCTYQYVYIWLEDGRSFWAWLSYVGRRSVAGWRWNGYYWTYFGTDLDNISSFECY